jgi:hypothetical protein
MPKEDEMQSKETSSGSTERRSQSGRFVALRKIIDGLIREGWTIQSRSEDEPVVLTRGRGTATVKPSGIVVYGSIKKDETE